MTIRELQGWYSDPFGRHEARYFSNDRPTKLVRDGDAESYDEPPGDGLSGPGPWDGLTAWAPTRAAGAGATGPDWPDDAVPADRRRRPGVLAAVAVVAIVGLTTAAVLVGRSGHATGATTEATEAMAYTATMNANSADIVEITALTAENSKSDTAVTESGPISWSTDQGEATMQTTTGGRPILSAREIFDGATSYSKYSVTAFSASTRAGIPGASGWAETTWSGTPSSTWDFLDGMFAGGPPSPGGLASPASVLEVLKAHASSIQNRGGEVLGGVSTTHYRALIPLPRQEARDLGEDFIGVDYWIGSAHLLRQLRIAFSIAPQPTPSPSLPGENIAYSVVWTGMSVTLKLSHYGVPVHVVAPPASQITSHIKCVSDANGFSCG